MILCPTKTWLGSKAGPGLPQREKGPPTRRPQRGPVKVAGEKDIYGRWQEGEDTPEAMYELLKVLLRGG